MGETDKGRKRGSITKTITIFFQVISITCCHFTLALCRPQNTKNSFDRPLFTVHSLIEVKTKGKTHQLMYGKENKPSAPV